MIEVAITVVGPSGALWEWIYMCSLICLMTSGRGARACDAVAEQGCAGGGRKRGCHPGISKQRDYDCGFDCTTWSDVRYFSNGFRTEQIAVFW